MRAASGAISGGITAWLSAYVTPYVANIIGEAIDGALDAMIDLYKDKLSKGCELDWEELLEVALKGALQGLVTGALGGKIGEGVAKQPYRYEAPLCIGSKIIKNLGGKLGMGKVFAKAGCMGASMLASAGMDEAGDALLGNCFVAGTEVWVLRDGIDADTANDLLAQGVAWEELATTKAIEDVEVGDHALSLPDDDVNGELTFMPVARLFTNTTDAVVEITVTDEAQTSETYTNPSTLRRLSFL